MEVNFCIDCKEEKSVAEFNNTNKSRCKLCLSIKQKEYRLLNKEKISQYQKERYRTLGLYVKKRKPKSESNEIKVLKYFTYSNPHIKEINLKLKQARKLETKISKRLKSLDRSRERRKKYKIKNKHKVHIRKVISRSIKGKGYSKHTQAYDILGCDFETFRIHIERQFTKGMNWDNHGLYGWHYDHIIPLATANNYEDIVRLNHYTNLRPLWWDENLAKSDNIIEHQIKFAF